MGASAANGAPGAALHLQSGAAVSLKGTKSHGLSSGIMTAASGGAASHGGAVAAHPSGVMHAAIAGSLASNPGAASHSVPG
jgi:hypothetical protein